jgi:hypothetical protein
LVFGER